MRESHVSSGFALARWIGLAMGLPALIAVVLLGKDTLMVVERINENALRRETLALERGLKLMGELNASEVLSQSMRSAASRGGAAADNANWVRQHFGSSALTSDGVQELIVVGPSGRAIFSSVDDGVPSPERVEALMAAAAPSLARARALYHSVRASERGFGGWLPGAATDGLYVNDIIKIDGHPTTITVVPLTLDSQGSGLSEAPMLLLGVQPMNGQLLGKLGTLSHIDGLRFVTEDHGALTGEHAHPISNSRGEVVAHVTWNFAPPGYAILRAALPAIALSLGLIALMTLGAAFMMRRLTRRLAESEQAAIYASRHDAATTLANRGWFMRVFADLLAPADGRNATYAVLLIDCDYFKTVNDTLGHAAGDTVLLAIADRLKALDGKIKIAARLGGDEFAVVSAPLACADDAPAHVDEILDALTTGVLFDCYVVSVSVSIGAVVLETPSTLTIDTWLARADMALYRAKREGRGCVRFYDAATDGGSLPALPSTRNPANDRAA